MKHKKDVHEDIKKGAGKREVITFARKQVKDTALQERDMSPEELFKKVNSKTFDAAEFIEVLDCLYILGKIEFLPGREVLHYVG